MLNNNKITAVEDEADESNGKSGHEYNTKKIAEEAMIASSSKVEGVSGLLSES
jgi:hypothetical protein